ncbi:MAG: hypothetical protein LBK02_08605 [Treponema sp.]|jgi:hypothetical protein|nr:hypothetical protein [Treponema sp.]
MSGKKQDPRGKEKRDVLLEVFGTPQGIKALNIILEDLRFFHWTDGEGERALNEYAKFFVRERLGVADTLRIAEAVMAEASQSRGRE